MAKGCGVTEKLALKEDLQILQDRLLDQTQWVTVKKGAISHFHRLLT